MGGTIEIDGRTIGPEEPTYIIAEIGSNHNQNWETTKELIDECIQAGADAVKFQSFSVDTWLSKDFTEFPTVDSEEDIREELRAAELPYEMYERISEYCDSNNVTCFSTPSHIEDVKKLAEIGVPAFKFGSVQITDIPTIKHAAEYDKPIILSGGASDMSDITETVEAIEEDTDLSLLHCTSLYPCEDYSVVNLDVLDSFQTLFDFPIGYSDHTMDPVTVPVSAVTKGADILEKHVTLDRSMEGPDHPFALEPDELERMVTAVRRAEKALGDSYRRMLPEEEETAKFGRRSVVSTRTIEEGDTITKDDVTFKRPGTGIEPDMVDIVIDRTAGEEIEANRVITWEMI